MVAELAPKQGFSLSPQNIDEALRFAEMLSKSSLVPKDFVNNPGNILVAIQWGMELGLQPMQAMQNIAVINGRPALWGDAVIALVRGSSVCEFIYETDDGHVATCRVKRRGEEEQVRTFSMEDAQKAGLVGKQGPWTNYPKRMRQMRARAFALRDVFPDVLRGMPVAEELQDMKDMGLADRVQPEANASAALPTALPAYTDEQFEANFPAWKAAIEAGRSTADRVVATVKCRYTLSQAQLDTIHGVSAGEPA